MASLSRRHAQRDVNKILVFFLVVFVLTTIGAFLWGYYGYHGQDAISASAKEKSDKAAAANVMKDYYTYLTLEMRLMLNDTLSDADKATWQESRREFVKEKGGKFANQKNYEEFAKFIEDKRKALTFDEGNEKYLHTESADLEAYKKKVSDLRTEVAAKLATIQEFSKMQQLDNEGHDKKYRDLEKLIQDKAKEILDANLQRRAAQDEAFARNSELITQLTKHSEDHQLRELQWIKESDRLRGEISKLEAKVKEGPGLQIAKLPGGTPHMLMMDMSMGKPLWDAPLGKILTIKGDRAEIIIYGEDRMEEQLKTGLTFNVFTSDKLGMADGRLKGTLEVITLLGGKVAACRVTSRFGGKDNPIVPEDLLFNLTWGTHVAVAGQVNLFSKHRGDSQMEQNRNLKHFLSTLERQGVIVDAYIDLVDGSIKGKYGAITPRTRFLIRGNELNELRAVAGALAEIPDSGDKDKYKELRIRIEEETKVNVASINAKFLKMHKDAYDNGMFIISPENFANVAGYRKLGGYGTDEIPFTPGLPAANIRQP